MHRAAPRPGDRRACRCGWRGGCSARSSSIWDREHAFGDDDVEVLEALAAQIALSVSRLQADEERDAAVAAMAEANQRLQLLAEAGRVLSGTLDIEEQIGELAELVVPDLGDWCWLFVTDEHGRLRELASAHPDPARRAELDGLRRAPCSPSMTDESGPGSSSGPGGRWCSRPSTADLVERALPGPDVREPLARLGAGLGRRRAAGRPRPDAGRARPVQRRRTVRRTPRPRSTPRWRSAGGPGWPCTTPGCSASSATLAETLQRSMLTAPPAARPLRDRRPLRPGRGRRGDRRRLVRRLRPARRGDRAGHRRRGGPRQPGRRRDGPAARAAAGHRPPHRRHPGRGAHRAGPRDPRAGPGHHGDRAGRPAGAGRPRAAGGADPAPLVDRRAPAAAAARPRRVGALLDGEAGRPAARAWTRTPRATTGSPSSPPAARCCSTPTGWSSAATATSTRASRRWWGGRASAPGCRWTSCATGC